MRHLLSCLSLGSVAALSLGLAIACGGTAATPDGDAGTEDSSVPTSDSSTTDASGDSSVSKDGGADSTTLDVNLGPPVAVRFTNCAKFTPCGGDPSGDFKVSDICVDTDAVLAQAKAQCPNISATNWNGSGAGGLTVAGTNWASMTQTKISVDILVPADCTGGFGCTFLAAALKQRGFNSATCKDHAGGAGSCDCSVTSNFDETSNGAFTQSGTRVTASNGTSYDYCRADKIVSLNPLDNGAATPIYYTYSE